MKDTRPKFTDRMLACVDCGEQFVFSAGEAEFFWSKQLTRPKRCKQCREKRRITIRPSGVEGMPCQTGGES